MVALVQRHTADAIRCIDNALETSGQGDLECSMRTIVQAGIAAHRIHPALHKILVEQVPRIGQMKAAMNTSAIVTRRLSKWFDEREQFAIVDSERTAFVVETIVEALTHRIIVDKEPGIPEQDLEDEGTRLLLAYIARQT